MQFFVYYSHIKFGSGLDDRTSLFTLLFFVLYNANCIEEDRMSDTQSFSKRIRYGDPDFEEVAMGWYEEVGDNSNDIDDCQSDDCEATEHDSDSNLSAEEENNTLDYENTDERDNDSFVNTESESEDQAENTKATESKKNYFGKNRFKWSSAAFQGRSRTRRHNIVTQLPGL